MERLGLSYVVVIRSNHGVWTFPGERVRQTRWRPFDRVFTNGATEQRYRCEFVFGHGAPVRYFVITTDPVRLPSETTWRVMTNLPGKIEQTVGNTFGLGRLDRVRLQADQGRTGLGGLSPHRRRQH